jgi:hypothetical protein
LLGDGTIVVKDGEDGSRAMSSFPPRAVALGRSCNGRREWIAGSETFGGWESRGVE